MQFGIHSSVPQVTMGHGALSNLKEISAQRVALVVDAYLLKTEVYKHVTEEWLPGRFALICDVQEEPSFRTIDQYIQKMRDYMPDCIVAIGGGSAMDTAKALWVFYELPGISWDKAVNNPLSAFPGKARMVAVPTTSGTGSEITGCGVYTNYENNKSMILSNFIRPSESILDYDLLKTIPPNIIAFSGADALAHALGALSCKAATENVKIISEALAVRIIKNLPESHNGNEQARITMHVCAHLAGNMINNAGCGLEHFLDRFAKTYHLAHGLIVGILLPYTMLYLMPHKRYEEIAVELGFSGEEKQRKLIDKIWQMYDLIGIPRTLKGAGVPENEFLAGIPEYIRQLKAIGNCHWVEGFMSEDEDLPELYRQAYYGL
jgi:alcohol dehydrogenase class IV